MNNDSDIKIFGTSSEISNQNVKNGIVGKDDIEKAKAVGENVARSFVSAVDGEGDMMADNAEMVAQRKLLLSFTATIGFEQYIKDDTLIGIANKSFLDTIKDADRDLYKSSSDTGAFSFYYLAYRRENDIERRIGQTFAMLCSHDGDPIFQELGEALFCWFSSEVRKTVKRFFD